MDDAASDAASDDSSVLSDEPVSEGWELNDGLAAEEGDEASEEEMAFFSAVLGTISIRGEHINTLGEYSRFNDTVGRAEH